MKRNAIQKSSAKLNHNINTQVLLIYRCRPIFKQIYICNLNQRHHKKRHKIQMIPSMRLNKPIPSYGTQSLKKAIWKRKNKQNEVISYKATQKQKHNFIFFFTKECKKGFKENINRKHFVTII